jgi:hypothetical protein
MEGYISTGGVNYWDIFKNYIKFKETIRNFFRDTDWQVMLERRLMGLTQKKSASEYIVKFQQLVLKVRWIDTWTNIVLFLKRLKPEIQYKTVKYNLEDFQEVIKIAVQVDNQLFNLQ